MRTMYLLLVALLSLFLGGCHFKDSNEILVVDVTEKYPLKKLPEKFRDCKNAWMSLVMLTCVP